MNLVVDTNIVFSTLLNPRSPIGEILMNVQDGFIFFAPDLLKIELDKYRTKIAAYSKLDREELTLIETLVLSNIHFVSEELISEKSWNEAFNLTVNIDEDDTPFIALAIEMNAKLWSGDKTLRNGLAKKGSDIVVTTVDLLK